MAGNGPLPAQKMVIFSDLPDEFYTWRAQYDYELHHLYAVFCAESGNPDNWTLEYFALLLFVALQDQENLRIARNN